MGVVWAILSLAALFAGVLAPGWCLARRLIRPSGPVEEVAYSIGLGLAAVPSAAFVVAWATGVPFGPAPVLVVAAAVMAACRPWRLPERAASGTPRAEYLALLALLAGVIALLGVTDFHAVRAFRFLECCLHSVASYLSVGDDAAFSMFDPRTGEDVTYVLSRPQGPAFGIGLWAMEQRPMNGAIVAVAVALSGRAGIELLALLVFVVVAASSALAAGVFLRSWSLRVLVGLGTLAGLHGIAGYMLNESTFALAFSSLALAALVREPVGRGVPGAAGILLGAAVGSRLAALALLLPLVIHLFAQGRSAWRHGNAVAAFLGFAAFAMPWFVAYAVLMGNPLFHTSEHLRVPHEVLGFEFEFRALNWPFFDSLVRAPADVLPPLLYVPVKLVQSAGSLLVAAGLVGVVLLARERESRGTLLLVLAWAGPLTLAMLVLADIDREKLSWLLVALPVVSIPLARFAASLAEARGRVAAAGAFVVLAIGVGFVPGFLAGIEVPPDPRPLPFLPYYIADGDSFNPRHGDESREDLSRPAFLPSFQDVATPSETIAALASPRAGRDAPPRRVFVRFDGHEGGEASFRVAATSDPAPLPEPVPQEPASLLQFVNMQTVFSLRVKSSPVAEVRVAAAPGRLRVEVDPGPLPHEPRHISFMVDEQMSDELDSDGGSGRTVVEVGGEVLATRSLGYRLRQGDRVRPFVVLVTNLDLPEQPRARGGFECGGERCEWEWTAFEPDGVATSSGERLDFVGPGYW